MDWANGYVTDIGYLNGYISELNPVRMPLPLLQAGIMPPEVNTACELGFGQGFSLAVHASASKTQWWGADINPTHAANAASLIAAGGGAAATSDASFADFCTRKDLPDFDFIGLHGVWSWIDAGNKAIITEFIRTKLKVGGVLYVSYNTFPGWNTMAPIRQIMAEHQKALSPSGAGRLARVDAAMIFAEKLLATNPDYVRNAPLVGERFSTMQKMDRRYLAHEFFNADWAPCYFAAMAQSLGAAKLTYAGSCHSIDHVDAMNHTPEQIAFLQSIPDPILRQSVRDVMVNQQFRRDYWIKGPRRLDATGREAALMDLEFVLLRPAAQAPLKAVGGRGEVTLRTELFRAVPEAMADHAPVSARTIFERVRDKNLSWRAVQEALFLLASNGAITLAQRPQARRDVRGFNAHVMNLSRSRDSYSFLASPVSGGAVPVGRLQQLLLIARAAGCGSHVAMAQTVQAMLAAQGERVAFDASGTAGTAQDERAQLIRLAAALEAELPLLQALGVVEADMEMPRSNAAAAA
ncbi:MAG: methyltransferase regulatory domain-containing protein [Caulobacterales bacterium]|jgi:hypothetical protein